ncbi:MAG: hypothetical protein AAB729_00480 [Patescibacteria group bacterium]
MGRQKILIGLIILLTSFLQIPQKGSALTFNEIVRDQKGKVLGDNTIVYPYPSGSLINENGTIYFIIVVSANSHDRSAAKAGVVSNRMANQLSI